MNQNFHSTILDIAYDTIFKLFLFSSMDHNLGKHENPLYSHSEHRFFVIVTKFEKKARPLWWGKGENENQVIDTM